MIFRLVLLWMALGQSVLATDDTKCEKSDAFRLKHLTLTFAERYVRRYRIRANQNWNQSKPLSNYLRNRFHYKFEVMLCNFRSDIYAISLEDSKQKCINKRAAIKIFVPKMQRFVKDVKYLPSEYLVPYKVCFMDASMDPIWKESLIWQEGSVSGNLVKNRKVNPVVISETDANEEKPVIRWMVPKAKLKRDYGAKQSQWVAHDLSDEKKERDEDDKIVEEAIDSEASIRGVADNDDENPLPPVEKKPVDRDPKVMADSFSWTCDGDTYRRMAKNIRYARNGLGMQTTDKQRRKDINELRTMSTCYPAVEQTTNRIISDLKATYEEDQRMEINRDIAVARQPDDYENPATFEQIVGTIEFEYQNAFRQLELQFSPVGHLNDAAKKDITHHLAMAETNLRAAFALWKKEVLKHKTPSLTKTISTISKSDYDELHASKNQASTIYNKHRDELTKIYKQHNVFIRNLLPDAITFNPDHMLHEARTGVEHFLEQFPKRETEKETILIALMAQKVPISVSFDFQERLFRRLNEFGMEHMEETKGAGIDLMKVDGHAVQALIMKGFRDGKGKPIVKPSGKDKSKGAPDLLLSDDEYRRPLTEQASKSFEFFTKLGMGVHDAVRARLIYS